MKNSSPQHLQVEITQVSKHSKDNDESQSGADVTHSQEVGRKSTPLQQPEIIKATRISRAGMHEAQGLSDSGLENTFRSIIGTQHDSQSIGGQQMGDTINERGSTNRTPDIFSKGTEIVWNPKSTHRMPTSDGFKRPTYIQGGPDFVQAHRPSAPADALPKIPQGQFNNSNSIYTSDKHRIHNLFTNT